MNASALALDGVSHFGLPFQRHPIQHPSHNASKSFQRVVPSSPSSPQQHGADQRVEQSETVTQSSREVGEKHPSREEIKARLKQALGKAVPIYRVPAKVVALEVGVSDATVENWRAGGLPDAGNLILLARIYPAIAAEVRRLIGMESELDPDTEHVLAQLRQLVIERNK